MMNESMGGKEGQRMMGGHQCMSFVYGSDGTEMRPYFWMIFIYFLSNIGLQWTQTHADSFGNGSNIDINGITSIN